MNVIFIIVTFKFIWSLVREKFQIFSNLHLTSACFLSQIWLGIGRRKKSYRWAESMVLWQCIHPAPARSWVQFPSLPKTNLKTPNKTVLEMLIKWGDVTNNCTWNTWPVQQTQETESTRFSSLHTETIAWELSSPLSLFKGQSVLKMSHFAITKSWARV